MAAATRTTEDVVCPFCSLACDDLVIEAEGAVLRMRAPSCPIAEREFARPVPPDARPTVRGEPATLDEAVAHAADLLARSRLPLFAGLGTDVAGMREVLALAERTGGIVDHAGSRGLMANVRAVQDGGWVTATLAEIRNRADLVLFVGTDGRAAAPRFVERCLAPRDTLFGPLARELVYLGDGLDPANGIGAGVASLPCAPERLAEAVAGLQALLAGNRLGAASAGGVPVEALRALAERLRSARYPVIVWAAGENTTGGQPDLLVGALAGLLREVNAKTRCAGLPLAGPDNVVGCNQVCAWQAGVPLRTSFAAGAPDHDPVRWNTGTLLAGGAVDCLVWIASLREQRVPATTVPTIALLRPGLPAAPAAEVTIPVGAPGLDHGGSAYRTDGVVAVPLAALRDPVAPSVAAVLADVGERLGRPAAA
jgi:formylmethanofuran dehydrogenase subunit B